MESNGSTDSDHQLFVMQINKQINNISSVHFSPLPRFLRKAVGQILLRPSCFARDHDHSMGRSEDVVSSAVQYHPARVFVISSRAIIQCATIHA